MKGLNAGISCARSTNFTVLVGWRICIWESELLSEIFSSLALDTQERERRYDGRGLEIYRGSADPCSMGEGPWKKNNLKEIQHIFSFYFSPFSSFSFFLAIKDLEINLYS